MEQLKRARPSPSIAIAILALAAAMTGAAVAGPVANKALTKKKVVKIADKRIKKKAPGLSVAHAASADNATNANSAQSANSAASVGGVSFEPVSIALPDPSSQNPTLISVGGSLVRVACGSGGLNFEVQVERGSSGDPPISLELVGNGFSSAFHPPLGTTSVATNGALGLTATIRENSGRVTRLVADMFYEANAYGGPEDCFVQGTIERFG